MENYQLLEKCYAEFSHNLAAWIPEGLIEVDSELLEQLEQLGDLSETPSALTHYFQVIEGCDKITLINERFIIWIVPVMNGEPATHTLIALKGTETPRLELAFMTQGEHNSSRLVLRLLEYYLAEIEETEGVIKRLTLA